MSNYSYHQHQYSYNSHYITPNTANTTNTTYIYYRKLNSNDKIKPLLDMEQVSNIQGMYNQRQKDQDNTPRLNDFTTQQYNIEPLSASSYYKLDQSQVFNNNLGYPNTVIESAENPMNSPFDDSDKNGNLSPSPIFSKSISTISNPLSSSKKTQDTFGFYSSNTTREHPSVKVLNFSIPIGTDNKLEEEDHTNSPIIFDNDNDDNSEKKKLITTLRTYSNNGLSSPSPHHSDDYSPRLNEYITKDLSLLSNEKSSPIKLSQFSRSKNYIIPEDMANENDKPHMVNMTISPRINNFTLNLNLVENDDQEEHHNDDNENENVDGQSPAQDIKAMPIIRSKRTSNTLEGSKPNNLMQNQKRLDNEKQTIRRLSCRIPNQTTPHRFTHHIKRKQTENLTHNKSTYQTVDPSQIILDEPLVNKTSNFIGTPNNFLNFQQSKASIITNEKILDDTLSLQSIKSPIKSPSMSVLSTINTTTANTIMATNATTTTTTTIRSTALKPEKSSNAIGFSRPVSQKQLMASMTLQHENMTLNHSNTILSQTNPTLRHAKTTLPQGNTTPSHTNTTSPQTNKTSPQTNKTSPQISKTSPHTNTTSPQANKTSPQTNKTSPYTNKPSPNTNTTTTFHEANTILPVSTTIPPHYNSALPNSLTTLSHSNSNFPDSKSTISNTKIPLYHAKTTTLQYINNTILSPFQLANSTIFSDDYETSSIRITQEQEDNQSLSESFNQNMSQTNENVDIKKVVIHEFNDNSPNMPTPNKPTVTNGFLNGNQVKIQGKIGGNRKKSKVTVERMGNNAYYISNKNTRPHIESTNADVSNDQSKNEDNSNPKMLINQLSPKISNINFANNPGKNSTNIPFEGINQHIGLHRKTFSYTNQPILQTYSLTQNDNIHTKSTSKTSPEKSGRATVTNATSSSSSSYNSTMLTKIQSSHNIDTPFDDLTPKKTKKRTDTVIIGRGIRGGGGGGEGGGGRGLFDTPSSNTSEIFSSIKDLSFSLMDSTKKFLKIGSGSNQQPQSSTTRLKCKCSVDLNEEETCPNAMKWLLTKYNQSELSYLKTVYTKLTMLNDFDESKKQISLDVNRTYPESPLFTNQDGLESMARLLECIAKYDPQIGYVQGMNFIAAALLYHAEEYVAFWLFIMIFEKFEMRDIYMPNLPGLTKHCQIIDFLILNNLPKIYSHFCKMNIIVEMFCTEWICALFGSIIPLEKMVMILEEFIKDGWCFFYKMILALLEYFQCDLLNATDMSDLMLIFKYNINNNQKEFRGIKHVKIKWENIIKSSKNIQIDTGFIHNLLTKFDQETKRFNLASK